MSNATPRTNRPAAIIAAAETTPVVDRTVYRATPAIIAGSVESNAFLGASRAWFTRKTVFAGLLGSL